MIGGKGIGKTFGLRKALIERHLKHGYCFAEFSRTIEESKNVARGYFDKLKQEGLFKGYVFKTEKAVGYIAREPREGEAPDWSVICYFVALTNFQQEKKRTFNNVKAVIHDEFIIDSRDQYRRYLPGEFSIFANLLDTVFRQQPGDDAPYRVFMMANAVDFTCPYLRDLGMNMLPDYGYHWYNSKHTIVHYVPPMDAELRKSHTLVGRMLAGHEESRIIFDNEFAVPDSGDIAEKPHNARFAFGLVFMGTRYGVWSDIKGGYYYITEYIPANSKNVYALTKKDMTINYRAVSTASELLKSIHGMYYIGGLRYESAAVRESFFKVLALCGIK